MGGVFFTCDTFPTDLHLLDVGHGGGGCAPAEPGGYSPRPLNADDGRVANAFASWQSPF